MKTQDLAEDTPPGSCECGGAEEWRPLAGAEERYLISSRGRVWRTGATDSGRTLTAKFAKLHEHPAGYKKVAIVRGGKNCYEYVHRLVLETFVGPCCEGMVALHWDDIPHHNCLVNLRWGTESENQFDKVRNGNHHNARSTHCKRGHEFNPENTMENDRGHRRCRTCVRGIKRRYADRMTEKYGARKLWPKAAELRDEVAQNG